MDIPLLYVLYMASVLVLPAASVFIHMRRATRASTARPENGRGPAFACEGPGVLIRVLDDREEADDSEAADAARAIEMACSGTAAGRLAGQPGVLGQGVRRPVEGGGRLIMEPAHQGAAVSLDPAHRPARVRQLQLALP